MFFGLFVACVLVFNNVVIDLGYVVSGLGVWRNGGLSVVED